MQGEIEARAATSRKLFTLILVKAKGGGERIEGRKEGNKFDFRSPTLT